MKHFYYTFMIYICQLKAQLINYFHYMEEYKLYLKKIHSLNLIEENHVDMDISELHFHFT